ncbi:MAG: hypothetical protein JW735_03990 [Prolixibacteraceae bacterium]|nr:hypothetical protein [Prolixibacteraceae bacterium]
MSNFLSNMQSKNMLKLNVISVFVTGICLVFAQYMFRIKALVPDVPRAKYTILLGGLIVIAALFLFSLASLIWFIVLLKKKRK